MESIIVVKVKYGDTLRRFNVSIVEDHKFGLNMKQLNEKMRSLFKLTVDDYFTLTYTDSDGDSVNLVDDCDLDDVVLQRLNPVRIVLNLMDVSKSFVWNSTPVNSSTIHGSSDNIQLGNVSKTVPESIHGMLLKMNCEYAGDKIGDSFDSEGSQSFAYFKKEKKTVDAETSFGLPGLKINTDAEVKAKEVESGFAVTVTSPNTCGKNYGKKDTFCPMYANGGSLNVDIKQYNGCPFSKARPDLGPYTSYKGDPDTQIHNDSDNVGRVSHIGVQCDGCDVHPITGPQFKFKSKVRHNYDLCSSCYLKSANKSDFVRIDSPKRYHHFMKTLHQKHGKLGQQFQAYGSFRPVADPFVPFTGNKVPLVNQVKLDSHFILDVNVMDGTVMAPSTPFTKIWRMKNNGNVVWPVGTYLVWTDGDELSSALSVDLEIPATGVPVEGEIDVAVDFVAPELPGEYVSYWRMSSASGQKFGQRVWVAIQVDASPDALNDSFIHLNLNVPPQSNWQDTQVVIDINVDPPMNNTFSHSSLFPTEVPVTISEVSSKVADLQGTTETPLAFEPLSEAATVKRLMEEKDQNHDAREASSATKGSVINEQDMNFPIIDFLLAGDPFSNSTVPPNSPAYSEVDSSKIETEPIPVMISEPFNETEESLLKQLSGMVFSQNDLNNEIFRKNAHEMEKTMVDHWDISEWDPIMDELEEMGFSDKKKNAILLMKNKGSIKRVVMDLVAGDQSL